MYGKILVPVDGSTTSLRGLDEAIELAKVTGATLKLLHIVNELVVGGGYPAGDPLYFGGVIDALRANGQKTLSDCERVARERGAKFESQLVETIGGRAADSILSQAAQWSADLIVMGTHGRRGIPRLALGSDAEMVLRQASIPVLMVRDAAGATHADVSDRPPHG